MKYLLVILVMSMFIVVQCTDGKLKEEVEGNKKTLAEVKTTSEENSGKISEISDRVDNQKEALRLLNANFKKFSSNINPEEVKQLKEKVTELSNEVIILKQKGIAGTGLNLDNPDMPVYNLSKLEKDVDKFTSPVLIKLVGVEFGGITEPDENGISYITVYDRVNNKESYNYGLAISLDTKSKQAIEKLFEKYKTDNIRRRVFLIGLVKKFNASNYKLLMELEKVIVVKTKKE